MRKIIPVLLLLLVVAVESFSQENCYATFYQKGEKALQQSDYDAAINNFKAAKVCPDKPVKSDVDEKIVAAQNAFINAIQKERKRAQSLALTAQSIFELQKNENASTAFRYAQYALEKDDNSESRAAFYEAAYQLESKGRRSVYSKSFHPPTQFQQGIKKVDFTPQGKFITVFTTDREALVYDLDGEMVASQKSYFNDFDRRSFSMDAESVALVGTDNAVQIFDFSENGIDRNRDRFSIFTSNERAEAMAFSPAGGFFAVGFEDGQTHLFRSDGAFVRAFEGHGQRITSLDFSPDDSLLITGDGKGVIGIYNLHNADIDTIVLPRVYDTQVVISPDKKHLLVSSSQRRARLLTIGGEEIFRTEGFYRDFSVRNFSAKGELVTLGNQIYSLQKGGNYGKLMQTLPEWVYDTRFTNKDFDILALGSSHIAQIWNILNFKWEAVATLGGHTDRIVSAAISPDGKYAVTAGLDLSVKLWPLETFLCDLHYSAGKLLRPMILEDSVYIITHKSKDIYLWNARTGYKGSYGLPVADIIAQSPDGKLLLTKGDEMADIWIFDPPGEGIRFTAGISAFHNLRSGSFTKDNKAVAIFQYDETFYSLTAWDLIDHKTRALGGNGIINTMDWSPDGEQLFLGNSDGEVYVWHYETPLDKMKLLKKWTAHERFAISHIAVSPDGKWFVTSSWDNTAKLWNADFEYITTLHGHTRAINFIDISEDSRFIITASDDRTAKIWDSKGQFIVSLEGYPSDVKRCYFSPGMQYVVTNYGDGAVMVWPFDPKLIIEKVDQFTKIDLEESEKIKFGIE